jgi:hypothetical protein
LKRERYPIVADIEYDYARPQEQSPKWKSASSIASVRWNEVNSTKEIQREK